MLEKTYICKSCKRQTRVSIDIGKEIDSCPKCGAKTFKNFRHDYPEIFQQKEEYYIFWADITYEIH